MALGLGPVVVGPHTYSSQEQWLTTGQLWLWLWLSRLAPFSINGSDDITTRSLLGNYWAKRYRATFKNKRGSTRIHTRGSLKWYKSTHRSCDGHSCVD